MISSILLQILGFFKLALFEVIYSITDPPMKYVQRFVPPLRLGGIALDLSFIVLLIAINLLQGAIRVIL